LWPFACLFGANVVVGIAAGMPAQQDAAGWSRHWHNVILVGAIASVVALVLSVRMLLMKRYWYLDDEGFTRGRIAPVRVRFDEIESFVRGMPDALPFILRALGKVPTGAVQGSMDAIVAWRRNAIVLRLRGRRLMPIGLGTLTVDGGAAFREGLLARIDGRESESYAPEEVAALARVRPYEVIELA
jgi:hypothetical protein